MQCMQCGSKVPPESILCPQCGRPVDSANPANAQAPQMMGQPAYQPYPPMPAQQPLQTFAQQPMYAQQPVYPQQPMYQQPMAPPLPPVRQAGTSIAPIILGILGIIAGLFLPIVGVILAGSGISLAVRDKRYQKSMATGGLVVSIVGVCISGLFWLLNILFAVAML